jgi:hypothetical protein
MGSGEGLRWGVAKIGSLVQNRNRKKKERMERLKIG